MNRTDRLYAIVEELRAASPGRRSARQLAEYHEVSVRTIERDIGALQQAGVPIYADVGRRGGYAIDPSMTLPPLNFTPAEAVAVAVALGRAGGSPLERAARSALRKIVSAMPARDSDAARELAGRVRAIVPPDAAARPLPPVPVIIENSLVNRRVLRLTYRDRDGTETWREVEPAMFLSGRHGWYLFGWCRLREDMRAFRIDRITAVEDTGEIAPRREIRFDGSLPEHLTAATTLR